MTQILSPVPTTDVVCRLPIGCGTGGQLALGPAVEASGAPADGRLSDAAVATAVLAL